MKKIFSLLLLVTMMVACGNKKGGSTDATQTNLDIAKEQTAVIYFHSNHRCATCMAVEKVSKEGVEENFKSTIPYYSVDITAKENETILKKYDVVGQSLLVVKGDSQKNLISTAVMYARSKPEKVKDEIKLTINSL